jgi:hypothetical protein
VDDGGAGEEEEMIKDFHHSQSICNQIRAEIREIQQIGENWGAKIFARIDCPCILMDSENVWICLKWYCTSVDIPCLMIKTTEYS